MKNLKKTIGILLFTGVLVSSCKKEDPAPQTTSNTSGTSYSNGIFVVNEGPFGSGSGTITFMNRSSKNVSQDLFKTANNIPLGNIAQSMTIHNGLAYLVVNNSNKVEVVSPSDFKSKTTISGLALPRYFTGASSSKGYISQWGSNGLTGSVAVYDINTNTISKTIATGNGPERMRIINKNLFVVCAGGYGNDSTLVAINTDADTISKNINIGHNPNSLVEDKNGMLWILCSGITDYVNSANSTPGKLFQIDPSTYTILKTISFSSNADHPSELCINKNGDKLFYILNGGVYAFDITASTLNSTAMINKSFYGIGVDPSNDYLLGGDAGSFTSDGWAYRYSISGSTATKIDSFKVGIGPRNFTFQ